MPYYQLYYHVVWATKRRLPLLTPDVEPLIFAYLRNKTATLEGVVYALNGVEDHVHLVVTIPPKIAVATFIGQIKGVASTRFNKEHANKPTFYWQDAYSVFSFDRKRLPFVVAYVENQKAHHAQGTTLPVLERVDEVVRSAMVKERGDDWRVGEAGWWAEMMALEPHGHK
ncbi:MAG: IS200/IS605 family transposase [Anaerolineales bacterium]|nr:IS200/IS605 family transposase [Anaerolineales bacterium]